MCHYGKFTSLRIVFFIISTIIGAGFASGQELLQFFLSFRENGIGGLLVTGSLLGLLSWQLIRTSNCRQLQTYSDLLSLLPRPACRLFRFIIPLFLFLLLISLMSAFTAIAAGYCQLTPNSAVILFIIIIGAAALTGRSGFILINLLIAPLLCGGIIMTSLYSICYHYPTVSPLPLPPAAPASALSWLTASLLYTGYNLLPLLTALIPFSSTLPSDKRTIRRGCLGSTLVFLLLSLLCFQTMSLHLPSIADEELPMLSVSCTQHLVCFTIYLLLMLTAIFSTALNAVLTCAGQLSQTIHSGYPCGVLLTMAACLLFKELDFSAIVHYGFPVFGLAGLVLLILLLACPAAKIK